jgi:hypothetical protein
MTEGEEQEEVERVRDWVRRLTGNGVRARSSTANTHQSKSRLMLVVSPARGCALQRPFSGLGTCSVNYL